MNNNFRKAISYILVLASLFIIILFTKSAIFELQANFDEKNSKLAEREELIKEFEDLKKMKSNISKNEEIKKYTISIKEDEIVDYIYSMIESGNTKKEDNSIASGLAIVKNISIKKGEKNEFGFLESNISLTLQVQSEKRMKEILNFFISKKSKYKFFVDSFSYKKIPTSIPNNDKALEITIPLRIFYK